MTFEEFFKKKRIDLATFQQAEPALFFEFKKHYEQMGEKSFDHTKKYWFNKIRRRFQLAPEIKTEKIKLENQLAEQTVTDELTEQPPVSPKVGFKPRFNAANMSSAPKQAENKEDVSPNIEDSATDKPAETTPAKPAFKPRFQMNMVKPKAPENAEEPKEQETAENTATPPTLPAENTEAKPVYKPRFNIKNIPPKPQEEE